MRRAGPGGVDPGIIRPAGNRVSPWGRLAHRPARQSSPQRKGGQLTTAHRRPISRRYHQPHIGQADAGAATARLASTVAAATENCMVRRPMLVRTARLDERVKFNDSPPGELLNAASDSRRLGPGWRRHCRSAPSPMWPVPTTREISRTRGPERGEVRRRQRPSSSGGPRRTDQPRVRRQSPFGGPPCLHASPWAPVREGTNRDNQHRVNPNPTRNT